jgi:hypothetical protein
MRDLGSVHQRSNDQIEGFEMASPPGIGGASFGGGIGFFGGVFGGVVGTTIADSPFTSCGSGSIGAIMVVPPEVDVDVVVAFVGAVVCAVTGDVVLLAIA